jgi:hypothetical protein
MKKEEKRVNANLLMDRNTKAEMIALCKKNDTTMAREIRSFVNQYIKNNKAQEEK